MRHTRPWLLRPPELCLSLPPRGRRDEQRQLRRLPSPILGGRTHSPYIPRLSTNGRYFIRDFPRGSRPDTSLTGPTGYIADRARADDEPCTVRRHAVEEASRSDTSLTGPMTSRALCAGSRNASRAVPVGMDPATDVEDRAVRDHPADRLQVGPSIQRGPKHRGEVVQTGYIADRPAGGEALSLGISLSAMLERTAGERRERSPRRPLAVTLLRLAVSDVPLQQVREAACGCLMQLSAVHGAVRRMDRKVPRAPPVPRLFPEPEMKSRSEGASARGAGL